MLTAYKRHRVRFLLAGSGVWITSYHHDAAPCDLCPPRQRIASNTTISGTYDQQGEYRICYKCMGKIHLKRELDYNKTQLRMYMPIRAKKVERVRQAEQRTGIRCISRRDGLDTQDEP